MAVEDIRWEQRYVNYQSALYQLSRFIKKKRLNEFEKQGLIQAFEYTYELAWNVIKDFYESQGTTNIQGSKDAFRIAFQRGLIQNGEDWMQMVRTRSLTSHTYNQETAEQIAQAVLSVYYNLFVSLQSSLRSFLHKD